MGEIKMKTILKLEIESPDKHEVFPEEGQSKEDFKGKEKELDKFRKEYAKELHDGIVNFFKKLTEETEGLIEPIMEELEEQTIEEWYELTDYGIKIKVSADNYR